MVRLLIGIIFATYLALGALFAIRTPAWQAPDEPAHYHYIAQVADGTLIPIIEFGDWDNEYLETLKANRFAPHLLANFEIIQYEDHQPPLYYWLGTPIFLLTQGNLIALRLYSVALGAITVFLAFRIGRDLFPTMPQVALGMMAFVAFVPQHLAILASVSNDALAGAVIALILWLSLRYLLWRDVPVWWLGVAVGLGFITKTTTYFMAGIVLCAVLFRDRPIAWRKVTLLSASSGVFALFWWGRNLITYGFPDFLGLRMHDAIVIGQLRTADYIAQIGVETYFRNAVQTTFNSFWGQFGWMGVPMPDAIYLALIGMTVLATLGWWIGRRATLVPSPPRAAWWVLSAVASLAFLMFLYYNTEFVQFQGRYLFTAMMPLAVGMVLGLDAWWRWLMPKQTRWRWLTLALIALLALLDVFLIWRVIPGALAPSL